VQAIEIILSSPLVK